MDGLTVKPIYTMVIYQHGMSFKPHLMVFNHGELICHWLLTMTYNDPGSWPAHWAGGLFIETIYW